MCGMVSVDILVFAAFGTAELALNMAMVTKLGTSGVTSLAKTRAANATANASTTAREAVAAAVFGTGYLKHNNWWQQQQ